MNVGQSACTAYLKVGVVDDPGNQTRHLQRITAIHLNIFDLLAGDCGRSLNALTLEKGCLCGDLNSFSNGPHLHVEIPQSEPIIRMERDVRRVELLETLRLHGNRVVSGLQRGE